jgi:GNAT superfamily N-acetyltransferase
MEKIEAVQTGLREILPFRSQFLRENNFQIRYNACHERNWSDSYLLIWNGEQVGYGAVKGKEDLKDRDAVFEFFVLPPYRKKASLFFAGLLQTAGASFIECQSNDFLLSSMLYEFGRNINSEVVLFEDYGATHFQFPEIIFRRRRTGENVFGKREEDAGQYVLVQHGEIVADGGFLTHYNMPFADLYMEVKADCRRQGLGSFILQEIKKECYRAGRVPAARCRIRNEASRATLMKAGFRVCGFMLIGEVV